MRIYQHDDIDGNTWFIQYRLEGRHHAATETSPEEWPEVVIEKITLNNSNSELDLRRYVSAQFETTMISHIEDAEEAFE